MQTTTLSRVTPEAVKEILTHAKGDWVLLQLSDQTLRSVATSLNTSGAYEVMQFSGHIFGRRKIGAIAQAAPVTDTSGRVPVDKRRAIVEDFEADLLAKAAALQEDAAGAGS